MYGLFMFLDFMFGFVFYMDGGMFFLVIEVCFFVEFINIDVWIFEIL